MSSPTATPRYCRCGTQFSYRVVDVLARPVHSGMGTADRLKAIPKADGKWFWCTLCDGIPRKAGR